MTKTPTYGTKTVKYTKEQLDVLNKELMESGDVSVSDPKFYSDWEMTTVAPSNKRKVNG